MTRYCGLSRTFIFFFAAAAFCMTLAAPRTEAQNGINVGDGVIAGDDDIGLCWHGIAGSGDGNCGFLDEDGGHLNLILGDSLSLYISPNGNAPDLVLDQPLLLIFGTPIQNLLDFSGTGYNAPLDGSNVVGAKLFQAPLPSFPLPEGTDITPYTLQPPSGIEFNDDPFGTSNPAFRQISNLDLLLGPDGLGMDNLFGPAQNHLSNFTGIPGLNNSHNVEAWSDYMYEVPKAVAENTDLLDPIIDAFFGGDTAAFVSQLLGGPDCSGDTCIKGFRIWIYELETNAFGTGDVIHIDTTGIPLGTMVTAWGRKEVCTPTPNPRDGDAQNCETLYLSPPATRSAIMMPLPDGGGEVPEPASLLLLGTGLLAIGKKLRKRQNRKDGAAVS
jgi:hypothetical protein